MLIMLIYWVEAYILCIKKNTEAIVVASKESGLEVNAEKFQYTWSLFERRMQDNTVVYATFGNHFASFVKTAMCCNETLVNVTRKCRATYLITVC